MINQTKHYDVLNILCTIENHKYHYNLPKSQYKVWQFALEHPVVYDTSLRLFELRATGSPYRGRSRNKGMNWISGTKVIPFKTDQATLPHVCPQGLWNRSIFACTSTGLSRVNCKILIAGYTSQGQKLAFFTHEVIERRTGGIFWPSNTHSYLWFFTVCSG